MARWRAASSGRRDAEEDACRNHVADARDLGARRTRGRHRSPRHVDRPLLHPRRRCLRARVGPGELDDDWVTALAVEGDAVCVGTYAHGVTKLIGRTPTRLGGGYINANGLLVTQGTLHAATMDGLIDRGPDGWNTRPGRSTGRNVTALAMVGDQLWVASRRGIAIALANR